MRLIFFLLLVLAGKTIYCQDKIPGVYFPDPGVFLADDSTIITEISAGNRHAFVQNKRVGFIDNEGIIVIPPIYKRFGPFQNGLAILIDSNNKTGIVDTMGLTVLPFEYDYILATDKGRYLLDKNKFKGFADQTAKIILPADRYNSFLYDYRILRRGGDVIQYHSPYILLPFNEDQVDYLHYKYIGVSKNNKWGFIDQSFKEIIPPVFDKIDIFRHGLAMAKMGDSTGVIDSTGKLLVTSTYDDIIPQSPVLLVFSKDKKFGAMDIKGRLLIPPVYEKVTLLANNTFCVQSDKKYGVKDLKNRTIIPIKYARPIWSLNGGFVAYEPGLYGNYKTLLLDKKGRKYGRYPFDKNGEYIGQSNIDLPGPYDLEKNRRHINFGKCDSCDWIFNSKTDQYETYGFVEKLPDKKFTYRLNGKYGLVDSNGVKSGEAVYDWIMPLETQHDPFPRYSSFIVVKKNGKWGLLNDQLSLIFNCEYDEIGNFYHDLSVIKKDGKCGMMNLQGDILCPPKYAAVGGLTVNYYDGNNHPFVERLIPVYNNKKTGFIDKSGIEIVEPKYDQAYEFKFGYCKVIINQKWGMIDSMGKEVIPCIYDELNFNYSPRYVLVARKNGKYGLVTRDGIEIAPFIFDGIEERHSDEDSCFRTRLNNKYGLLDFDGKEILAPMYEYFEFGYLSHLYLIKKDGKYGFVSSNGRTTVLPEYDEIKIVEDNTIVVRKDSSWGLLDQNNKFLFPLQYKSITARDKDLLFTDFTGSSFSIDKMQYTGQARKNFLLRDGKSWTHDKREFMY